MRKRRNQATAEYFSSVFIEYPLRDQATEAQFKRI
jgi:hypothetical protein